MFFLGGCGWSIGDIALRAVHLDLDHPAGSSSRWSSACLIAHGSQVTWKTREHPLCWGKTAVTGHLVDNVRHSLTITSIHSLPEEWVALMIFDFIFVNMAPRRSTLPICSGAFQSGRSDRRTILEVEPNTHPRSQRTTSGQPAQRVQPCTNAHRRACGDVDPKLSDSLTIHA